MVYAAGIITVTFIHSVPILTGIWVLLILADHQSALRILKRTAAALLLINTAVSAGYLLLNTDNIRQAEGVIILFNLRTGLLLYSGQLAAEKIRFFRALEFLPSVRSVLYIGVSQYYNYVKLYKEFSYGYRSRSRPRSSRTADFRARWMFLRSTLAFILRRALDQSEEITLAMKSRGFFIK